jgi:hypothetical protein
VDATAKSLEAFERGVHLIMGGKDKGAPYTPLRPLLKDTVREILLIGAAAERIAQELAGAAELIRAGTLERAVLQAFLCARPGDVVLLAPACSSFDQFQDYEQRGRVFKELVGRLAQDIESGAVKWKWKPGVQAETGAPESLALAAAPPQVLQVSSQEVSPEIGEVGNQVAEAVESESKRPVATGSATEDRPQEPTLVYEISAQDLPPAEIEPAQNYFTQPEMRSSQAFCAPEKADDVRLPYESRADERSGATGGLASREFAEGGATDTSGRSNRSAATTDRGKPNSAATDSAPQPRLPGMD